jgi:hypothetical protein
VTIMLPFLLLLAVEIQPGVPVNGDQAVELRQPQLASAHGQVAMTYGSGSTVYFASSADGGRSFGRAVKVADVPALALGRHRGPRIAILSDAIVIAAVSGNNASQGDLLVWRSMDKGKTWQRGSAINDVRGAAREGLHSLAADRSGNLFAAWLDLREKGTRLYGSRSTDGGLTWSRNIPIYVSPDGTICQCCDPSVAIDEKGETWVMWRNALNGSRDLYLAHTSDGVHFSAAQKLGEGTWKLEACPMDGGGVTVEHGNVYSAWRRGTDIYLASPGRPEIKIGQGKDVSIAAGQKGAYVVWSGPHGIEMHAPDSNASVALANEGAYPNVVTMPDGSVLAAWETKGSIHVERLP